MNACLVNLYIQQKLMYSCPLSWVTSVMTLIYNIVLNCENEVRLWIIKPRNKQNDVLLDDTERKTKIYEFVDHKMGFLVTLRMTLTSKH